MFIVMSLHLTWIQQLRQGTFVSLDRPWPALTDGLRETPNPLEGLGGLSINDLRGYDDCDVQLTPGDSDVVDKVHLVTGMRDGHTRTDDPLDHDEDDTPWMSGDSNSNGLEHVDSCLARYLAADMGDEPFNATDSVSLDSPPPTEWKSPIFRVHAGKQPICSLRLFSCL